jgi:hypothetical protein
VLTAGSLHHFTAAEPRAISAEPEATTSAYGEVHVVVVAA